MTSLPLKIVVLGGPALQTLVAQAVQGDESVEILGAGDLSSPLELARPHDPALALLDLDLPGTEGCVQQMRDHARFQGVPVIQLGSLPAPAGAIGSGAGGPVDFLLKPVTAQQLSDRLRPWLDLAVRRAELDERQQELQRLARLQAATIGDLSHDVRTPLSALALHAELVARGSDVAVLRESAQRVKGALAMLGRQIDHLVNVAGPHDTGLRPIARVVELRALAQDRLHAFRLRYPTIPEWTLAGEGDAQARLDQTLIGDLLDGLLQLAAHHSAGGPVALTVHGHARRSVTLRIHFAAVLPEAEQRRLFAGASAQPGLPAPRVGPGLAEVDSIARAHGGSLVGLSRASDGTLFECMLPRGMD